MMHQQINLSQRYSELNECDMWFVRVVDANDSNEEGYKTLDEALAYIRDVAERSLRPVAWGDILTTER